MSGPVTLSAHMETFGSKLRQAREARGISLREVAASTKISISALEGLDIAFIEEGRDG